MKKLLILIVSAALLLSVTGCRREPSPGQDPGADTEPEVRDLVIEVTDKKYTDEFEYDGATVAGYSYTLPYLKQSDERGDEIVKEFNDFIENTAIDLIETFEANVITTAQDDYDAKKERGEIWDSELYMDEMTYQVVKGESYLGVALDRTANFGGAFPSRDCVMMMYDLNSGRFFKYTDLTDDVPGYKGAIAGDILAQIKEHGLQEDYYDDYETEVGSLENAQLMFDEEGLTVLFPEFILAPHAVGEQVFMVAYPEIEPYFNDYAMKVLYEFTGEVG